MALKISTSPRICARHAPLLARVRAARAVYRCASKTSRLETAATSKKRCAALAAARRHNGVCAHGDITGGWRGISGWHEKASGRKSTAAAAHARSVARCLRTCLPVTASLACLCLPLERATSSVNEHGRTLARKTAKITTRIAPGALCWAWRVIKRMRSATAVATDDGARKRGSATSRATSGTRAWLGVWRAAQISARVYRRINARVTASRKRWRAAAGCNLI